MFAGGVDSKFAACERLPNKGDRPMLQTTHAERQYAADTAERADTER